MSLLLRFLAQTTIFLLIQGALFLVAAGTWRWPQAWALMALYAAGSYGIGLWLWRHDPVLLIKRIGGMRQPGVPRSDQILLGIIAVAWIGWCLLMGMDHRWQWSGMALGWNFVGAALIALCFGIVLFVFRENSFAAPVIQIQSKQEVIESGPYAWVRHPMYGAALLFFLGMPLLLGSWTGLALIPVLAALLEMRARIEERTLHAALPAYDAYRKKVPWRFVPYLW